MKMTSFSLAQNLQFIAQSGPTWDPLPPFQWSLQDQIYERESDSINNVALAHTY